MSRIRRTGFATTCCRLAILGGATMVSFSANRDLTALAANRLAARINRSLRWAVFRCSNLRLCVVLATSLLLYVSAIICPDCRMNLEGGLLSFVFWTL